MKKAILFLVSQGITLFGSSIVQFAIIWYVTLHTSSGLWVSAITVAAYLPQFIVSFFSGAWADRYSRKLLIILSDGMIALATLLLALVLPRIAEGTPMLLALVALSVIRSIGAGIQTPAVNAAVPQLVPEEKLMKFNGIQSTIQSLVQFAAPAVAGAVLSVSNLRATLLIDIFTALVGIGVLFAVALPRAAGEKTPSMLGEMKAGFLYTWREPSIRRILLLYGLFIFLSVPAGFLASLFVGRYYGSTYWALTLVEVVGFLGMAGGGVLIGAWGGFKNRAVTLLVGVAAFGALAVGMGVLDSFVIYLILSALCGIAITMAQTASTTLLQQNAAPEMLGRVFGLFGAMYSGFLPLGMLLFGPLADAVSLRVLMAVSGVLLLALAGVALAGKRSLLRASSASDAVSHS